MPTARHPCNNQTALMALSFLRTGTWRRARRRDAADPDNQRLAAVAPLNSSEGTAARITRWAARQRYRPDADDSTSPRLTAPSTRTRMAVRHRGGDGCMGEAQGKDVTLSKVGTMWACCCNIDTVVLLYPNISLFTSPYIVLFFLFVAEGHRVNPMRCPALIPKYFERLVNPA